MANNSISTSAARELGKALYDALAPQMNKIGDALLNAIKDNPKVAIYTAGGIAVVYLTPPIIGALSGKKVEFHGLSYTISGDEGSGKAAYSAA